MSRTKTLLGAVVVLSAFGLCLLLARAVFAQRRSPRDQLALELACVAAHEGALDNLRDVALVWQVVEAKAVTTSARLKFLRAHSPRALGIKGCVSGNCLWSSELRHNPLATPSSVDAGFWSRVRARDWALVMRKAQGLVYGIDDDRPCPESPFSWGYAGDLESAWRQRGLIPMGCAGVLNDGFRLAPKALRASVARGARR